MIWNSIGAGPDLLLTLDVVEDAAVAGLSGALAEGAFAPFEVGAQIEAVKALLGEEVAHLVPGDVDEAVLDSEDVLRVSVETATADKGVELGEAGAVEEDNRGLVRGDRGGGGGLGDEGWGEGEEESSGQLGHGDRVHAAGEAVARCAIPHAFA